MHLFKKITLSFIALSILFCALVWLISPWLVRSFAADTLAQHNVIMGPASTVRLNLFISRLSVSDVTLKQNDQNTFELSSLQLDYSLWRLIKKEVHIQRVYLSGVKLQVVREGEAVFIAGLNSAANSTVSNENTKPTPSTEPAFIDTLSFYAPEVIVEKLEVSILNERNPHHINIQKLTLQGAEYIHKQLTLRISLQAIVDGTQLDTDSAIKFSPTDSSVQLSLALKGFQPTPFNYLLPATVKKLDALLDVAAVVNVNLQEQQLTIQAGEIEVDLAKVQASETVFQLALDHFRFSLTALTGEVNLATKNLQVNAKLHTELSALHVGLSQSPATLLALQHLNSGNMNLSLNNDTASTDETQAFSYKLAGDQLVLEGLTLSKTGDELAALLAMDSITLNQINITPELIKLDTVALGKGQVDVNFDEAGKLLSLIDTTLLIKNVETTPADIATPTNDTLIAEEPLVAETESAPASLPKIQLQKLSLVAPLAINIVDRRHSQTFEKVFEVTDIDIGPIDSVDINTRTQLNAHLKDEDYFTGEFKGWITPFTKQLNADTHLTLREFSLHEVAPYLKDSLGFEVKAGQLDLDLKGLVKDDQLSSKSVMLMRGTAFGASEQINESNVIGQTAIPLNVALNMLKDGKGNIKLTIPVNGDVHDPRFGVHHVVGLIVTKVVMSQAKKYLMNMFVPYAQVVSVAMSAGSYALKVRFADLSYAANQTEVSDAQQVFITQMTALMKDKEDLQVSVCPVATLAELPGIEGTEITAEQHEKLLQLAEKRAKNFKSVLVKEGGIESARLLLCSPSVDKKAGASARIAFGT